VTVSRTVVPGEWYGVLGDDVIVLLPPEAKSRVAGLWETVDDGAGFDEVLDALISDGLRSLPSFVLVSGEGREVKVVIRGAGRAELRTADGPVSVVGSADSTWVERNVGGVTGLEVTVADATGEPYAVGTGLVRVAGVEHPARAASSAPVPLQDAEAIAVPVAVPEPLQEPEPEPARRILPPDPQLEPERPHRILPPDPQLEPTEPVAAPVVPPVVPPVLPPVVPPVVPPVPVSGVPASDPAYDPLTSPDLSVTPDHGDHTADLPEEPAAPSSRPVARLIVSNGEVVDVDRTLVIGRAPDHGRYGGTDRTRLVTVPSPHQEISSTHLEVRPGTGADVGSAVATDLGSTNGTVVVQPGRPAEDLRPGIAVALTPGALIDLGEGVTIQVTRP